VVDLQFGAILRKTTRDTNTCLQTGGIGLFVAHTVKNSEHASDKAIFLMPGASNLAPGHSKILFDIVDMAAAAKHNAPGNVYTVKMPYNQTLPYTQHP
jgi:hypothetical protein